MPPPHAPAGRTLALGLPVWAIACVAAAAAAGELLEDHEGPGTRWLPAAGTTARVVIHDRDDTASHRGARCERFVLDAGGAERIRVELPFGPAALLDELRARVWVRCSRGDVRIAVRVVLPEWVSRVSGRAVEVLLPGTASRDVERWEMLEATALPAALGRSLAALRLEHGNDGGSERAVATHVVLDLPPGSGRLELAIDDLAVTGIVAPAATVAIRDAAVRPAALAGAGADPPAGLARGVLEVDGQPFFPRVIDWNGEPLDRLAALGFNAVRCPEPATAGQLDDARRAGLWVVCPPPPIPDVDLREPESLPMLRHWDRVLMWDLGSGLADKDVEALAERTRRLRACDPRPGRPVIAAADSGLRALSRHVDLLVARRQVLGTSLELVDHLRWLRERPRLARPGTPLLATLATEIDPRAAAQAAALAGVGGRGLAVDPESLSLAACAAVAAGTRGILCGSTRPLVGDDRESRARAAAAREMNLRLKLLEPWGAAGRFAAQAQVSSPEVQAFVLEAARTRIVIAWRCVQGAQIVARRYEGGDLPPTAAPLTIVVPGMPEAHQAWECVGGGLRPLKHQRVTGGVSLTLDDFVSHALVLVSGEPAVTAHVQQRLVDLAPLELVSARELAALGLADAADLLARLPARALSGPPPVAAVAMLSEAGRLAAEGETLAASDPAAATARYRRAAAIAGQFERRVWENAVKAAGSMVASPLCVADSALAEEWNFVAARTATAPGPELVPSGGMERLEELAGAGWRHFARPTAEIRSGVEVSRDRPASGAGCLRMTAVPASADEAPVVVETPPVWVTTPPLAAPAGRLVEIAARVRVPRPVSGSVDGLFVFDSLGGPALGERVGVTGEWRRLALYRIVPAAEAGTPLVVTFALTGIGEACIDDVSVRVLDRLAGGVVATPVAAPAGGTRPFPGPSELLAEPPPPIAAAAPPASAAWPGMRMEWPRLLPFGQGSADPPPGPGGGTIDPFKRARAAPSPPP